MRTSVGLSTSAVDPGGVPGRLDRDTRGHAERSRKKAASMQLSMTVLRCPDTVTPEARTLSDGEFHVGRGPDVDWVLPDPDRLLSKRHFAVAFREGTWQVADTSTNGTWLNTEPTSIGRGAIRALRDGDRLRLGRYEIEIRLDQAGDVPKSGARRGLQSLDGSSNESRSPQRPPAVGPEPHVRSAPAVEPPSTSVPERPSSPGHVTIPDGDADLLTAFFAAAGLAGAQARDPRAVMTSLGHALRAVVSGLRAVLIARAAIKGEFRIDQTMNRARGNNPLKFSTSDDDALSALLGLGRQAEMTAAAAIEEALRDLRTHELATASAMKVAIRALLEELDPHKIRAASENDSGMAVLPAQRKARAWDAFEARHDTVSRALVDDFDSVFGKSFARAYESALVELARVPE
jgi:predicted component of type VI protein secretion system